MDLFKFGESLAKFSRIHLLWNYSTLLLWRSFQSRQEVTTSFLLVIRNWPRCSTFFRINVRRISNSTGIELEEMANYQDDFFGPIRVPVLKRIDRSDVRDFLERYRKYVIWVTERARLEGAEPQIMQMKMCINSKLLKTLARFELKTSLENVSDEQLEEYLTGVLAPSRYHVPDLDRLFGRLRLRSEGDGRDRVTALFADIEELVHDHRTWPRPMWRPILIGDEAFCGPGGCLSNFSVFHTQVILLSTFKFDKF